MASTYVNDLRLNEMATGDGSGTWGTTTNTNLELIAEAFGYGTEGITTNADTHTSTIADGATDPVRSMYVKYTGTLDSACTITIAPNTVCRMQFIENATSGSQNIIISQGSGANITIPAGDTKAVYLDGAGSGAAVVDAFASLSTVDLKVQDDLTVTGDIDVDGTTNLDAVDIDGATQADGTITVGVDDTGYDVKFFGATASAYMLWDASADDLKLVGAAGLTVAGDIDVDGTTNLDVVDIDGAVDMASTLQVDGAITSSAGATITTADNLDTLSLISTDADANSGPNLRMYRNSGSPAGNDLLGNIQWEGRNNNSQDVIYSEMRAQIETTTDGSEDANYKWSTMKAGSLDDRFSINANSTVFNDDSKDVDFRVESNGNANMLFVDGGNDRVGINTATPLRELDARDGDGVTSLGVGNNAAYVARSQSGTHAPALKFMASDGTLDSPTDSANGDYLGAIGFTGYHTNGYYTGAQIDAVLTGTNGTSDMPSALRFLTSADGSATPSERARIRSGGGLLVGTTSGITTSSQLELHGNSVYQYFRNTGASAGATFRIEVDTNNTIYILNNSSAGVYMASGNTGWTGLSDETLKENITDIGSVLDKVKTYRTSKYNWVGDEKKKEHIGFIAQDWEKDFPQVLEKDGDNKLGINYAETNVVLLKAIQEQQVIIDDLKARIKTLEDA